MLAFVTLGKTILNCGINTSNKRRLVLESHVECGATCGSLGIYFISDV